MNTGSLNIFKMKFGSGVSKWAELLLLGYLVSPILVYAVVGPRESALLNGLYWFNVLSSVLWLLILKTIPIKPLKVYLLIFPIFLLVAADLFLIIQFKARLSAGYLLIAASDAGDAFEFFQAYSGSLSLSLITLMIVLYFGIVGLRNVERYKTKKLFLIYLVILTLLYITVLSRGFSHGGSAESVSMDLASKEMSSPAGVIFQSALAQKLISMNSEAIERRSSHQLSMSQSKSISSQIIVLVIGESSRPQNWSVFGYSRKTTPRLDRKTDIVLLRDLITTAPHTSVAVPSMLSLGSIQSWDSIASSKSVISAFKHVGYQTYWASTQEADGWGGLVPIIAQESKHRHYFDRSHDRALVDYLSEVLKANTYKDKIFIVLHTKGSHFEYSRRYPKEFEIFKKSDVLKRDALVNSYDNTILYTDYVISEIIDVLNNSNRPAAMVYISDHGENLMDDERQLFGHAIGTEYDLRSAGLVWLSDSMIKYESAKSANLMANANKPISVSDVGWSLLSLANIEVPGSNEVGDIFSKNFTIRDRYYEVRGNLFEYKNGDL